MERTLGVPVHRRVQSMRAIETIAPPVMKDKRRLGRLKKREATPIFFPVVVSVM